MTKNLLLEIGLEEIPAHIVTPSSKQLVQKLTAFLKENRLEHGEVIPYSTPRRLAVVVKDIAEKQEDIQESVKGPAKKSLRMLKGTGVKLLLVLLADKELLQKISTLKKSKTFLMFMLINLFQVKPLMKSLLV